jgi:hypothetical protein
MTLHSVATSYSESPTSAEKELMYTWLDLFRDTITCPNCRDHFTTMLASYRAQFPNMLASRQEFSMFSFRAHNAVNRRLNKPLQMTLVACMETLRNNIKTRSALNYRVAYINHITRHWNIMRDVSGMVAMKKLVQMRKIEDEYITGKDTKFAVELGADVVVLPRDALEREPQMARPIFPRINQATAGGFRIVGGRIGLRR